MYSAQRPRPHLAIPPGAQQPVNPSPSARYSPYNFEVTPPPYEDEPDESPLANPWDSQSSFQQSPMTPRPRTHSLVNMYTPPATGPPGSPSQVVAPTMDFPQPTIFRSTSARPSTPSLHPVTNSTHRYSHSYVGHEAHSLRREVSANSLASSYYQLDDSDRYSAGSHEGDDLSTEVSNLALASHEGVSRFQSGTLPEKDQEWHKLVPTEAREALGKQEVQRQSVIFELFKSERDYVSDLEAVKEAYIDGLRRANPPIIDQRHLPGFIHEVFGNLDQILSIHQRMLGALFARQRDQHPLVQSVADIILDTVLKEDFRAAYDIYIKHYPLSESHHRTQLKTNPAYQTFVQAASVDPRIRKRDLITFLSRPVTRLPRLNLLLEQIHKLTYQDNDHPDLDALPIITGILSDFIKSTQPGIEAAENKVKFWALCESLVFRRGEIIDLDLYDDCRSLILTSPVYRRTRGDSGFSSWSEISAALIDNHFLLMREEQRGNGPVKRFLMSRPLPLSYLRLGAFNGPEESRKERSEGVLGGFRSTSVPIYPFTIYHASNMSRRYTLCVSSEALRKKWHSAFVNSLAVHKARQEGNMFFNPQKVSERFFRTPKLLHQGKAHSLTGKVSAAVSFMSASRRYIVVASSTGVYVAPHGSEKFVKVLRYTNVTSMAVVPSQGNKALDKFLVKVDWSIVSYSLDLLARLATGQAQQKALDASLEKIASNDVLLFKYAQIGPRALVIYASKKTLQVSLGLHAIEVLPNEVTSPKRSNSSSGSTQFRRFGEPGYIPKDAYDIVPLVKTVGICTNDGIVIIDPTNLAKSAVTMVPDFSSSSSNEPMDALRKRIESGSRPLGLTRVNPDELLVIYDNLGCYINKHGAPGRSSGYVMWESSATSYAHQGTHILLFSNEWVEIRNIVTGKLVQTVSGIDIRLLHAPRNAGKGESIVAVMRGEKDEAEGISERIVELVETLPILPQTPGPRSPASSSNHVPALWEEWDM